MKAATLALLALFGLAVGHAHAEDLPAASPTAEVLKPRESLCFPIAACCPCREDWTGCYLGLNLGAAFNDSSYVLVGGGAPPRPPAPPAVRTYLGNFTDTAFLAGGQIGYNHQVSCWFVGLESDFNWTNLGNSDTIPTSSANVVHAVSQEVDWFGTVRGRLGFAGDSMLLYVTGGLAYGQVGSTTNTLVLSSGNGGIGSTSGVQCGWTVGAGAQWKLTERWSVKAEYLWVDLGSVDYGYSSGSFVYDTSLNTQFHVLNFGLVYRLGGRS